MQILFFAHFFFFGVFLCDLLSIFHFIQLLKVFCLIFDFQLFFVDTTE